MASLTLKIDKHLPVKNAEVLKVFMKKKTIMKIFLPLSFSLIVFHKMSFIQNSYFFQH